MQEYIYNAFFSHTLFFHFIYCFFKNMNDSQGGFPSFPPCSPSVVSVADNITTLLTFSEILLFYHFCSTSMAFRKPASVATFKGTALGPQSHFSSKLRELTHPRVHISAPWTAAKQGPGHPMTSQLLFLGTELWFTLHSSSVCSRSGPPSVRHFPDTPLGLVSYPLLFLVPFTMLP